jgi:hypothetical protein
MHLWVKAWTNKLGCINYSCRIYPTRISAGESIRLSHPSVPVQFFMIHSENFDVDVNTIQRSDGDFAQRNALVPETAPTLNKMPDGSMAVGSCGLTFHKSPTQYFTKD